MVERKDGGLRGRGELRVVDAVELIDAGDQGRSEAFVVDGEVLPRHSLKVDRGGTDELRVDLLHLLRDHAEALGLRERRVGPIVGDGAQRAELFQRIAS